MAKCNNVCRECSILRAAVEEDLQRDFVRSELWAAALHMMAGAGLLGVLIAVLMWSAM